MRPKSMLLIMIALGCGLVAAFAAFQVIGNQQGVAKVETAQVFVALNEIDIDDPLDSTNVALEEWPRDRVPEGTITKLEELENKYAAQRLYKGEVLLSRKIIDATDRNAKTLQIPDGYRVCTTKVEIDTANNGLLNPGDRVDVMVFLRKTSEVPFTGIRTILRDVRVFAVDSETERTYDNEGNKRTAKTVSFLVKPDQAGKLLLASQLGVLQLSLRHPGEEKDEIDIEDATLRSILEGIADDADEDPKSSKFEDWVGKQKPEAEPPAPTAEKPRFVMQILSPEGAQTYRWARLDQLPTLHDDAEDVPVDLATPIPAVPTGFAEDAGDRDVAEEPLNEDNF